MGCGVACLAMISNMSYNYVRKWWVTFDSAKTGLTLDDLLYFLGAHAYWIQLRPIGDCRPIHLYSCFQILHLRNKDKSGGHFIAMQNGKIFDPANKDRKNLTDVRVEHVIEIMRNYSMDLENYIK